MDQTSLAFCLLKFIGFVIAYCVFVCTIIVIGQSDLLESVHTTINDKIITPALKMIKSGVNRFVTSFNKFQ